MKWYRDETKGTAFSVTDDFYKHFKLSKTDVYGSSVTTKRTKTVTQMIDGVTYEGTLTEE